MPEKKLAFPSPPSFGNAFAMVPSSGLNARLSAAISAGIHSILPQANTRI